MEGENHVMVTDGVPTLLLAYAGLMVGVLIKGVVESYHRDRSFWPWPQWQIRDLNARWPTLHSPVNPRIYPCCPHSGGHAPRLGTVELVAAVVFSIVGTPYVDQPLLLVVTLAESAVLVAVLFIDLELLLIPTPLVRVLVLLALTSATVRPELGLRSAILGGAVGYVSFLMLVTLARQVYGEGALGSGDTHLALAIGCITGYPLVVPTLALGALLGGLGALGVLLRGRGGRRSTLPYGPYLVIGVLYVLARGTTMHPFP